MKKMFQISFAVFCLCVSSYLTQVHASDSAVASGIGFTVSGSIYDSTLNGSITGDQASGGSAKVAGYCYDVNGQIKYAGTKSGQPYVNYSISQVSLSGAEAWKWQRGRATGTPRSGTAVSTRWMYN